MMEKDGLLQGRLVVLLLFLYMNFITTATARQCYFVNGERADDHSPCDPNLAEDEHSTCCIIDGNTKDLCTNNYGLCFQPYFTDSRTWLYQAGCTDPTGEDPGCKRLCPESTALFYAVVPCPNGEFCCSETNDLAVGSADCCDKNTFSLNVGGLLLRDQSNSTSSSVSTSATIATTNGSPSPSAVRETAAATVTVSACATGSKSAIVGASVGASLGGLLVAALAAIWVLQRRVRALKDEQFHGDPGAMAQIYFAPKYEMDQRPSRWPMEMPSKPAHLVGA